MQSNVGILERDDGSFTETDYEAANVLNSFLPVCSLMSPYLTSQVYLTSLMEKIQLNNIAKYFTSRHN